MNEELKKKLENLDYELTESEIHEWENSKIFEYTKKIDNYIIQLHCNYPIDDEIDDEFLTLEIFDGHIGNSPPAVENGKIVSMDIGEECIIADSNEADFISNIDKWDNNAQKRINQFIELTPDMDTNQTRTMGVSTGFFEKVKPNYANQKVGRNKPCPCGSGKKFKYCHGA